MKERAAALFPFAIAVALPPAGLLIGAMQYTQDDGRELGLRLMIVAALAALVWAALIVSAT
jgi:hypothetical protein